MATVAATVIEFMKEHPDAVVVAVGSTPSGQDCTKSEFPDIAVRLINCLKYMGTEMQAGNSFKEVSTMKAFCSNVDKSVSLNSK